MIHMVLIKDFAFGLKNIDETSDIDEKDLEPENHLRFICTSFS